MKKIILLLFILTLNLQGQIYRSNGNIDSTIFITNYQLDTVKNNRALKGHPHTLEDIEGLLDSLNNVYIKISALQNYENTSTEIDLEWLKDSLQKIIILANELKGMIADLNGGSEVSGIDLTGGWVDVDFLYHELGIIKIKDVENEYGLNLLCKDSDSIKYYSSLYTYKNILDLLKENDLTLSVPELHPFTTSKGLYVFAPELANKEIVQLRATVVDKIVTKDFPAIGVYPLRHQPPTYEGIADSIDVDYRYIYDVIETHYGSPFIWIDGQAILTKIKMNFSIMGYQASDVVTSIDGLIPYYNFTDVNPTSLIQIEKEFDLQHSVNTGDRIKIDIRYSNIPHAAVSRCVIYSDFKITFWFIEE